MGFENRTQTPADRIDLSFNAEVLHSLHGYFLLPGRTDIPIVDVEAMRDGGSFSSRRVVARQGGKVIFYLSSSFTVEDGFEHLDPLPEDVPPPEQCPKLSEVLSKASGRPISFWEQE